VLLLARAVRAFGDGFVSILLPAYLLALGLGDLEVGAIATATLLGSALLTLLVGFGATRFRRRTLLIAAGLLMALTGLGFDLIREFSGLLLIAFVGTLNPSSGDVSVFLAVRRAARPARGQHATLTTGCLRGDVPAVRSARADRAGAVPSPVWPH
jgi:MFS family permease